MPAVLTAASCFVDSTQGSYRVNAIEVLVGATQLPSEPRAFGENPDLPNTHWEMLGVEDLVKTVGKLDEPFGDIVMLILRGAIRPQVLPIPAPLGKALYNELWYFPCNQLYSDVFRCIALASKREPDRPWKRWTSSIEAKIIPTIPEYRPWRLFLQPTGPLHPNRIIMSLTDLLEPLNTKNTYTLEVLHTNLMGIRSIMQLI